MATEQAMGGRDVRFAVIGAGMAGVLTAIKLQEAGITNFTVYEKADKLGGTWRENTYPGIGCDVPSHLYSYSFEPNPDWSHRYSPGAEIQTYFEDVAAKHDVTKTIRFGSAIVRCEFNDGRWELETADGHTDTADFVIAATGVLHHPKYPEIEGLDSFAGDIFHSARWDHDVSIEGKRFGVIGSGSTATQIVTGTVDAVAKLSMFQRTPQWIMPQENPVYSDEEKQAYRDDPEILPALYQQLADGMVANFANAVIDSESPQIKMVEEICRQNLESSVHDPALLEKLRPTYRAACKRLVISTNFYECIQRPNAELVSEEIERIEPEGIRTVDGRLHELDVLVLATGFKVDAFMRPMNIRGRDGVKLDDVWRDRPGAYLSITIPGFPNFFMLNGPNGPVGNFSLIEVAEMQLPYIMQLAELVRSGQCNEVSVSQSVADSFEEERVEAAKNSIWTTGCNSWYLDDRGIPASWPWTFDRFREEMAAPKLEAFELV